jgi:cytoskeletal protein RodZ
MSKKSLAREHNIIKWLVLVLIVIVVATATVWILLFATKPEQSDPDKTDNNTSQDDGTGNNKDYDYNEEPEEYKPVDFVTEKMQEEYREIYRTQGLEAVETRVYKDFEANGVEFNWGNPYHTVYLNFQEEMSSE